MILQEEITNDNFEDTLIEVFQKEKGEMLEGRIISLSIPMINSYTSNELIELGNWLVEQGLNISKKYTLTGKLKETMNSDMYVSVNNTGHRTI